MLSCQPFFFSFAAPRERIEVGSCYPSRLLLFTGCRSDPWVEVQVLSPPVLQIYGDRSTIFHWISFWMHNMALDVKICWTLGPYVRLILMAYCRPMKLFHGILKNLPTYQGALVGKFNCTLIPIEPALNSKTCLYCWIMLVLANIWIQRVAPCPIARCSLKIIAVTVEIFRTIGGCASYNILPLQTTLNGFKMTSLHMRTPWIFF